MNDKEMTVIPRWVTEVNDEYTRTVETMAVAAGNIGRRLIEEKAKCGHGEWGKLTGETEGYESVFAFNASSARRFMKIAGDKRLSNRAHAHDLPYSWYTQYELTKLEDSQFYAMIEDGTINPDMERKDISDWKNAVKKAARQAEIQQQEEEIASSGMPVIDRKYHVISIDPPWPYEGNEAYDPHGRRGTCPYPLMSIEEIAGLHIPSADDCVMWLWTTHRFMRDSYDLLDAWGFEYKATMVWDKQKMGIGRWLRMQCEFCLLAVKGNPVFNGSSTRDILSIARREHSRKPDEFFSMVDDVCVGAKLEYFSREKREGWDQFGNDLEKF